MSDDSTDPGFSAKAHKAALKAQEAAKKADPFADRALYAIQGSEYTAVIVVVIVLAIIGAGMWAAW